ncbi:L-arabinose transport system permease protein AraP [Ruminiclostridium hungatei]|uniref:L-arabinose transport system permease protein AraP n=2 Tax=Ruminiclostridium hungatei TaxID=48256 RepID=A0A1V4SH06_RUMHU|nr:sugar ABC transporter permease [Ruminiclostridium hungatei]OPX42776.1 L-arabinose transport system permease protein AraP [Ruminiclostridium hungatei]
MEVKRQSLESVRRRSTAIVATLFLLPVAFFLIVYIFRSVIYTFKLSTLDWNGVSQSSINIGLGNWKTLIHDATFFTTIKNNIIMVIACLVIQMPIALVLAYLLDWANSRFKFLKSVYFLPLLMSSVALGFLFKQLFDSNYGLAGALMKIFTDSPFNLLANEKTAIWAVIGVISWQFIPFYMIYYFAGLTSISPELFEAAVIDGAKHHQYIFRISLPILSDTIKAATIMCIVGSLKYFDLIYVMTEGGPSGTTELMATYMYKNAFTQMKMGYGSTIAAAMFIIITTISLFTFKMMNMKEEN